MMEMRKLFLSMMIFVPTVLMAQSDWQLPKQRQQQLQEQQNKANEKAEKKAKAKAEKEATEPKATKAKAVKVEKDRKMKIDAKYAKGAVPEVDGLVEWDKTISCPGQSADQLYSRVEQLMEDMTHAKNQQESQLSAVNPHEHVVAGKYIEEMVFTSNFISKDFTHFRYTLIATCHNGSVDLRLCRISYKYNIGRSEETTYMAEDWITDKEALNKYGTNTYPGNGKFRKKTIDRKEEIFAMFEEKLKK